MKRIGLIGPGAIAQAHLDGWTRMPGVQVVGYYDVIPEVAQRGADKWGGRAFATQHELFDAVDVVDICTPGTAHKENVLLAASAHVPIIC